MSGLNSFEIAGVWGSKSGAGRLSEEDRFKPDFWEKLADGKHQSLRKALGLDRSSAKRRDKNEIR